MLFYLSRCGGALLLAITSLTALADQAGWAALAKPGPILLLPHAPATGPGHPPRMTTGGTPSRGGASGGGRG